jgi:NADPH-dependent 2,4-dienoyl-CoA reductase/sulfur reductase-like enzyme
MTRALITDPEMPRKAAEGRLDEVLRCIGCNACIAHYHAGTQLACAQNPRTGREARWPNGTADTARRVAVVGAGPAGLAAAVESGRAGHDVVLFEASDRIGGQAALAGVAPGHAELAATLVSNYERLLNDANVDVRFGVQATVDELTAFDALVVATGARPFEPTLPLDGVEVVQAWEVLAGERPSGRVVIADWGGDPSGLDVAELLLADGNDVTLVLASVAAGEALHQYQRNLYLERLYRAGVVLEHHLDLTGAQRGEARFRNVFAPELERAVAADALVLALGRVPAGELAVRLAARGVGFELVGDCATPRSLEEAILEGTQAAQRISAA